MSDIIEGSTTRIESVPPVEEKNYFILYQLGTHIPIPCCI